MKRNMDLIRKLILLIEDDPSGFAPQEMTIEGFSDEQIAYHQYLLVDSGLADGQDCTDSESPGPECFINHLTSAGHDFADSIRNEFIWNQVRSDIAEKGIKSTTIDTLKKLLDKKIRKHLNDQ